jgi:hypothetical protein
MSLELIMGDTYKKLFDAPEAKDFTGLAKAEVVKKVMEEWGIKKEVCFLAPRVPTLLLILGL